MASFHNLSQISCQLWRSRSPYCRVTQCAVVITFRGPPKKTIMAEKGMILLLLSCFSCMVSSTISLKPSENASLEAKTLFDDYWKWRISESPEFATSAGFHEFDTLLNEMSESDYFARLQKSREFLQRVEQLEPSLTAKADVINLKVLKYELETYIGFYELKGIYMPLTYGDGPHANLKYLFKKMPLKVHADYEVLIQRMEKIPLHLNQTIDLLKAGVENNITRHEISLKGLNHTIGRFVVENASASPLYDFFKDGFPANFTPEQITEIQTKAEAVITQTVSPAFAQLLDYILNEYVTRDNISISSIRRGKEFYDALIWFHTSTNYTAEKIHNIGLNEVDRIEAEMLKVVKEMGHDNMTLQEFSNMIRDDPNNYFNTTEELIAAYEDIIFNRINPQLSHVFKNIPQIPLTVESDPTPGASGAYYIDGAKDGSRPGTFYVKTYYPESQPKFRMMSLALHEANPGHHFQFSTTATSPDLPLFRKNIEYGLAAIEPSRFPYYNYFLEGWALYAEGLGFDMGLYEDPLERFGHYNEEIYRAVRLVVDTGIHALGWTKEEAVDYMFNHTSFTRTAVKNQIERYITSPGQALGYKMGQLKIRELRSEAEKKLGPQFDLKKFHELVLKSLGPMNLVEDEVREWVASTSHKKVKLT